LSASTGKECVNQAQGFVCWPCAKVKAKCEPGSERKAAGTRRPAPTKKALAPNKTVKVSQVQPDRAKSKVGPSRQVPVPGAKPCRRLVKSAVYVFDSDNESKEKKAGPSQPAPAPVEGLFGSDEESEPIVRKEKGKGRAGKSNHPSVFYILIDLFEDDVQALRDAIKAHKHQNELFLHQIGQIHEQMDDQDQLVGRLKEQLQEAREELASQSREITDVYVRLG
jgi:hypothetical protein